MQTNQQNLQAVIYATSQDGNRPALQYLKLTETEAQATDGYILASCPITTNRPGFINPVQIKKALKLDSVDLDNRLVIPSRWQQNAGQTITIEEAPEEINYPPVDKVRKHKGDNRHLRVGLSLQVLESLVKMMKKSDTSTMALEFSENPHSSIYGEMGEIELTIMPARVEG